MRGSSSITVIKFTVISYTPFGRGSNQSATQFRKPLVQKSELISRMEMRLLACVTRGSSRELHQPYWNHGLERTSGAKVCLWLDETYFQPPETLSVPTRHRYGISVLVSPTSFRGETSGGISKCRLSSQASFWGAYHFFKIPFLSRLKSNKA